MQLTEIETVLAILVASSSFIGVIVGFIPKGRLALFYVWSYFVGWFSMPTQLAEVRATIRAELTTNGGGSMRDLVVATAASTTASEARSRAMLSQLHVPFWESDSEGRCVFYSRELSMLSGWTPQDVLGRGWISTIHPADRAAVISEWDACTRDGREFVMDYAFISPDGRRIEIHAEALTMRDGKGRVIGYVGRVARRDDE